MSNKRGPSVLVTDARERPPARPGVQRQSTGQVTPNRMRFISVDNVLQYASEIPSGQPRVPPGSQHIPHSTSSTAGRPSLSQRSGSVRGLPNLASARTGLQIVPSRTTKISEKLVLLPENDGAGPEEEEEDELGPDEVGDLAQLAALDAEAAAPPRDDEMDKLRRRGGVVRGRTYAERLPKGQRAARLSRVTAFCTAQSYRVRATAEFLRDKHGAKTKLYDDCLYVVYHLPLLLGQDGNRVRSRPILKTPGTGKTVLDIEIERSERRDEHVGYFDEDPARSPDDGNGIVPIEPVDGRQDEHSISPINRLAPDAKTFAEMFVFSYGVVVFWNFTERQEKDILADLTFAGSSSSDDITPLITRPLPESDFETEEFHFEYSSTATRPRVFNDMITLLPRSDHMVRLSISHAIAQSTKLCFFEEKMSETMQGAQHVPKRLALTGELSMTRTEIVKILGRLFKSRVDINLSSNILDVPNFFWDSEPNLHPLYVAVREYLEIGPRIKVLNERCRVFLDLAEILSDSVADAKMSSITWIIIVLIIVSIIVTVTEVALRFGILENEKRFRDGKPSGAGALELRGAVAGVNNMSLPELRAWGSTLSAEQKEAILGADVVGTTYAGV